MSRLIDLTALRFGRLTVLGRSTNATIKSGKSIPTWLCQCDCGTKIIVWGRHLRNGAVVSCKCKQQKHGLSHIAPEYIVWSRMHARCYNKKEQCYERYGGRGIAVCERWHDFTQFLSDMGPRPSNKHQIERDDNDGPYEPSNCRWATAKEQARNRRSSRKLTYQGETLTIAEWAERTGLRQGLISLRVTTYGWPVDEALSTPPVARGYTRHGSWTKAETA